MVPSASLKKGPFSFLSSEGQPKAQTPIALVEGMDNSGNLTTDHTFDVLSRLSTRDVLQLKCVSKSWQDLISDRTFIQVLSRKKEPSSGFFFQQRYQWCKEDMKIISYIPLESKGTRLRQNIFDFLPQDVVVLSSCNGLICCRSCIPFHDPAIYVCNPLNKEWHKLDWNEPKKQDSIALAFDPLKDFTGNSTNFSAVRVHQYETELGKVYFSFDIYSSKTRNWKVSKGICWGDGSLYKNKGVFIGGILHWLTDGDQILTFSVDTELAWLISVPVPANVFTAFPEACIGESEGQLYYIVASEEGLHAWYLEDCFDCIWSLKWSKALAEIEKEYPGIYNLCDRVMMRKTIDDCAWMDPLAFKDGILLMRVANTIYLYWFETGKTAQVCDVSEFGTPSTFCPTVLSYSMSLVPLNNDA